MATTTDELENCYMVITASVNAHEEPVCVPVSHLNSLEILIFDELNDDVFLWLNLQHLQCEAEEGSGLDVPTKNSSNKFQLHGFVNNQLSCD